MHLSSATAAPGRRYSFYQKLFFLYILNLSDWLCTEALLATGRFVEANPIMNPVMPHFLPTLLLKGILPLGIAHQVIGRIGVDPSARACRAVRRAL